MNYIINPSWFYWLQVVDSMKFLFAALSIGFFIALIVVVFVASVYADVTGFGPDDSDNIKAKKLFNVSFKLAIITAIVSIIYIFIPSRETLIEMQVAKFATYENAAWTVDKIKEAVDYIVQSISSLK